MKSWGEKSSRRYAVPMSLIKLFSFVQCCVRRSRFRKVVRERAEASVHYEVLAGDVTRRVGGEIQEGLGDVIRACQPVQRHAWKAVLAKLAHLILADQVDRSRRVSGPRAHAVDPDAVPGEVDGHDLHKCH